MKIKNSVLVYCAKFIGAFCILYFGTMAIIGLAAPGDYYSAFIHDYLDYPALLRKSLLHGAKISLSFFGYDTYILDTYYLRVAGGRGIRLVYSCLGTGVMSFWTAFVIANRGSGKKKLAWIFAGLILIWMINIIRIALLLVATNKNWPIPFHIDSHTLFNIIAYGAILIMIFLFDRANKQQPSA
ncbi:MAG: hypothetical protein ABIS01_06195 [Ferruginibacter sp.]